MLLHKLHFFSLPPNSFSTTSWPLLLFFLSTCHYFYSLFAPLSLKKTRPFSIPSLKKPSKKPFKKTCYFELSQTHASYTLTQRVLLYHNGITVLKRKTQFFLCQTQTLMGAATPPPPFPFPPAHLPIGSWVCKPLKLWTCFKPAITLPPFYTTDTRTQRQRYSE